MSPDPFTVPCPHCKAKPRARCRRVVAQPEKRVWVQWHPPLLRGYWEWQPAKRKNSPMVVMHPARLELAGSVGDMLAAAVEVNRLRAWLARHGGIFRTP